MYYSIKEQAIRDEQERLRRLGLTPSMLREIQERCELIKIAEQGYSWGGGDIEFLATASSTREGRVATKDTDSNESAEEPQQIGNRDRQAKGDPALLDESGYTNRPAAMRYLGIHLRQLQELVKREVLVATGRGNRQAISNQSLMKYQPPLK